MVRRQAHSLKGLGLLLLGAVAAWTCFGREASCDRLFVSVSHGKGDLLSAREARASAAVPLLSAVSVAWSWAEVAEAGGYYKKTPKEFLPEGTPDDGPIAYMALLGLLPNLLVLGLGINAIGNFIKSGGGWFTGE
ncbi:unnamed protein product [Polarella glacialis]|uniref:Uncharacterized protein n=1 Tax=Polarella glacialis TaxID=89957 RepID=A0A813DK00_POLGL|nr:unnamed protein product [Polarella glacialis]CAE8642396.1 unnamed protein product [Polarella glacialis]CAE8736616.1 unnamed protein product [Polarella glacialis]|mmetsp:Transcript_64274/g.103936  ORF Transcript_64274/g.103936 Transcript_64274/m.103936 type:complete len:135 (+) Transcript_64274:126-530(+)